LDKQNSNVYILTSRADNSAWLVKEAIVNIFRKSKKLNSPLIAYILGKFLIMNSSPFKQCSP